MDIPPHRQHADLFTEKSSDPPDDKEDPDRTKDLEQMEEESNVLREILVALSTRREVVLLTKKKSNNPHTKQAPPPNTIARSKPYIWTVHPEPAAR